MTHSRLLDPLVEIKEEDLFSVGGSVSKVSSCSSLGKWPSRGMEGLVIQAYGREVGGAGASLIGSNRFAARYTLKTSKKKKKKSTFEKWNF